MCNTVAIRTPGILSLCLSVCLFARLNNPTATVYGFDADNTGHAVILTLSNPIASSADKVSVQLHLISPVLTCKGP